LEYIYDGTHLIEIKGLEGSSFIFVYNQNVLVEVSKNDGKEDEVKKELSYDKLGRLIKIVEDELTGNYVSDINEEEAYNHTYDDKKNPLKNIVSKEILSTFLDQTFKHNELSYSRTRERRWQNK